MKTLDAFFLGLGIFSIAMALLAAIAVGVNWWQAFGIATGAMLIAIAVAGIGEN